MANDDLFLRREDRSDFLAGDKEMIIPVVEEYVSIDKKKVQTGVVSVVKKVAETAEAVDVILRSEGYEIERVAINEFVEDNTVPATRREGDTIIYAVLKEVVVKRTLLVEEVRITKKITQTSEHQDITLRTETVEVKRKPITEESKQTI